jgi:hypothetical protein
MRRNLVYCDNPTTDQKIARLERRIEELERILAGIRLAIAEEPEPEPISNEI